MFTVQILRNGEWLAYAVAGTLIVAMDEWRKANRKGHTARIVNQTNAIIH